MSEKEILRNQAKRLGVIRHFEEVTKSIAKACRYFARQPFEDVSEGLRQRIQVKKGYECVKRIIETAARLDDHSP
jgi:hypothetical protein